MVEFSVGKYHILLVFTYRPSFDFNYRFVIDKDVIDDTNYLLIMDTFFGIGYHLQIERLAK